MPIANPQHVAPDHGHKLSAAEFERQVVALHAEGPAMPSRAEERRLRRAEFELAVDYRLGLTFAVERRERLWAAQRRVDRRRYWYLFKGLFARSGDLSEPLTRALIKACANELDRAELCSYFDLSANDVQMALDAKGHLRPDPKTTL